MHFRRGGRRDFVMRATKSLLIEPPAIHRANQRSRFSLARKCSECIFEFFNRIGHFPTFTRASQYLTETGRSKLHPGAVDNLLDHLIHVKQYCLRNAGPSALVVGWL